MGSASLKPLDTDSEAEIRFNADFVATPSLPFVKPFGATTTIKLGFSIELTPVGRQFASTPNGFYLYKE
jgi:hypothetical protein